jgi:hypothetical protein
VPVGELLAWSDPRAVAFGRRMYGAIHGSPPPADLSATSDQIKGDVGVWAQYWCHDVHTAIREPEYMAFEDRCFADVSSKRKDRRIKNLGGLARRTIVPGILAAMAGK